MPDLNKSSERLNRNNVILVDDEKKIHSPVFNNFKACFIGREERTKLTTTGQVIVGIMRFPALVPAVFTAPETLLKIRMSKSNWFSTFVGLVCATLRLASAAVLTAPTNQRRIYNPWITWKNGGICHSGQLYNDVGGFRDKGFDDQVSVCQARHQNSNSWWKPAKKGISIVFTIGVIGMAIAVCTNPVLLGVSALAGLIGVKTGVVSGIAIVYAAAHASQACSNGVIKLSIFQEKQTDQQRDSSNNNPATSLT